jgi:hypothetical protein
MPAPLKPKNTNQDNSLMDLNFELIPRIKQKQVLFIFSSIHGKETGQAIQFYSKYKQPNSCVV